MSATLARPRLISLAAGFTDNETLPLRQTRDLIVELMADSKQGRAALQYGSTSGHDALRALTAARIQALDRVQSKAAYDPDQLILSNGSQQLLYLVTEALCDPGDIVLVEDPSYFVYLSIVQSHGLRARGVRMQPDGVDVDHLEHVLNNLRKQGEIARVKLFYSVSYHQNPSSATTTLEKKRRTLKLLCAAERFAKHPIYYLEDAAYRELRFEGEDVVSALAIPGARSRVIYTGTYSKPFATGARVGFGIFPEPVHTSVLHIKGNHDFGSSSLLQRLLARAIESGAYEQHLATLRRRYRHKAATMLGSLKHAFPAEVRWWEPHGGLYYWVQLPKRVRTGPESGLFRRAIRNDVLYVPGRLCYASDPSRRTPDNEMRLSFGAESEANVSKGIERLGKAIRAAL